MLTLLPVSLIDALSSAKFSSFDLVRESILHARDDRRHAQCGLTMTGKRKSTKKKRNAVSAMTEEQVDEIVLQVVASLLDVSEMPRDIPLMDLGLDSLGASELAGRLSSELGVRVLPTLVFSYPTLSDILTHMKESLGLIEDEDGFRRDDSRSRKVGNESDDDDAVAIVGVGCRLPGDVYDLPSMWAMLLEGRDHTGSVSHRRWDADALMSSSDLVDASVLDRIRYGGFLSDEAIESFDASRFGISEAEAGSMDPSQRMLLEVSYDALADAGYSMEDVRGRKAGVFVGISGTVETCRAWCTDPSMREDSSLSVYDATSTSLSVAAGRVSYVFGLQGPCSSIDTACSSSMVALHNARRSLQNKECELAMVLGSNLLGASSSISCAIAGMTSPDGKCLTFDESANGYCRGEGGGAFVLKRLRDAIRDGDGIYAVVRGSAVMQDGKSASLTAPNGLAQEKLIRCALEDAGLEANDVSYIETHGTGTKLGDPIETAALASVYGLNRDVDRPLYIGGVKANIGHLEASSGLAGMLSAILALHYGQSPPNAQLRALNSKIVATIEDTSLVISKTSESLRRLNGRRLVAGVSSFGYSGTIAHALLEEAPEGSARQVEQHRSSTLTSVSSSRKRYSLGPVPHRMLQQVVHEAYSGNTICSVNLHAGIHRDWLKDHVVHGQVILPGAAMVELMLSAGMKNSKCVDRHASSAVLCLKGVSMVEPVICAENRVTRLTCVVDVEGKVSLTKLDALDDVGGLQCEGHFEVMSLHNDAWATLSESEKTAMSECKRTVAVSDLYTAFASCGLSYGAKFRLIEDACVSEDGTTCVATLSMGNEASMRDAYLLPPPTLDAMLQLCACVASAQDLVLVSVEQVTVCPILVDAFWASGKARCVVRVRDGGAKTSVFDCMLLNMHDEVVLRLESVRCSSSRLLDQNAILELGCCWDQSIADSNSECRTEELHKQRCLLVSLDGTTARSTELQGQLLQSIGAFGEGCSIDVVDSAVMSCSEVPALGLYDTVLVYMGSHVAADMEVEANAGFDTKCFLRLLEKLCALSSRLVLICPSEFSFVTLRPGDASPRLEYVSSTVWAAVGVLRIARLEYSRVKMTVVYADADDVACVSKQELLVHHDEFEVAYVKDKRYVKRYVENATSELTGTISVNVLDGGTFVVTGGLGAIGLLTAKVLADRGAKRLILVSRSGRVSYEGQGLEARLIALQERGDVDVHVMQCDISDEAAVVSMLSAVRELCEDTEGIDGVVHSAGTLRDAIIRGGGAASGFDEVWSAKAQSAYWLHKHTAADKLRLFVVFSSITAAIGNIGQSSYGAANNFMDGLVERRVRMGLAGQSIRWPAISDMGMAASTRSSNDLLSTSMSPSEVEALLSRVLSVQ
ncbi:MAG: SDR family NAD(P)-dependent oxidoreductase, partial [Planctomycetes bacterium]|nr:SDR family NAD(P)-dependent oxidoreductase [Planctomycetota bacterium]